MIARSAANLTVLENWVEQSDWIDFLAENKDIRSSTSICLKIIDHNYLTLPATEQQNFVKEIVKLLEVENVAFDIASYRDASWFKNLGWRYSRSSRS